MSNPNQWGGGGSGWARPQETLGQQPQSMRMGFQPQPVQGTASGPWDMPVGGTNSQPVDNNMYGSVEHHGGQHASAVQHAPGPPPMNSYPNQGASQPTTNKSEFGVPFGEIFGSNQGSLLTGMVQSAVMEGTNSMLKEMGIGGTQAVTSTMESLLPDKVAMVKHHFNVSHEYVVKKTGVLLAPFMNNFVGASGLEVCIRDSTPDGRDIFNNSGGGEQRYLSIVDLYLPVISVLTYVILCGFYKGITSSFHPEVLQTYLKVGVISWIAETMLGLLVFSMVAPYSDLTFLVILGITGYKFLHINVLMLLGMVMPSELPYIYWLTYVYVVYACCHATFGMLTSRSLDVQNQLENDYSGAAKKETMRKKMMAVSIIHAVLQMVLIYFLNPSGFTINERVDALSVDTK